MHRFSALFILLLLCLSACESARQEDPQPVPLTTSIALQVPQLQNDSTAVLTWSALNNPDVKEYRLKRWEVTNAPVTTYSVQPTNPAAPTVTYADGSIPYSDEVQYQVVGVLASGKTIESNTVIFRRPGVLMARAHLYDVLFDEPSRTLYFFSRGGIVSQYSLAAQQIVKTIQVGQSVEHGSLATFQGRRELYLPTEDGRVFIYDAASLTKLDEVRVNYSQPTRGLTSVLSSNGLLYITTTDNNGPTLRIYDRATKAPLPYQNNRDWYGQRLYQVPGSGTELVGMALYVFPMVYTYYSFTPAGTLIGSQQSFSQRNHQLDGRIFEFLPTGSATSPAPMVPSTTKPPPTSRPCPSYSPPTPATAPTRPPKLFTPAPRTAASTPFPCKRPTP
ncbi:hypothetical protein [Hymenobacter cellulosilyticus]|uniref:Fibronectin type-III domain-containing protein n=1 Tax=Hymenobacter cellulosilyticus TaxID=2932248 RepID=A0A8T9Q3F3_9BACT|nr:hypothetical protein [Hymenobacter cellulosilyticus]UOQ71502.1 hypothetical protein MUN79_23255 [Hymenobacter cellulosilyticus]